jgi:hypothetical protein
MAVSAPNALLLIANRTAIDSPSRIGVLAATVVITVLAGYAYSFSFKYNDGEYGIVYFLVPLIQAPFAIAAFVVARYRRRRIRLAVGRLRQ